MDRLRMMQVFVTVADCGGFSAAAKVLKISAPAATRAVAALEARLGSSLFARTTRAVRLTAVGQTYLADCRRVLADVDAAERSIMDRARAASRTP